MLLKPESCKGCPLYGNGKGFVPDEIVDDANVLILMQNPGADEEAGRQYFVDEHGHGYRPCQPQPAIGKTGYVMDTDFLPLAGLKRGQVSIANVLKCRQANEDGSKSNELGSGEAIRQAVDHCLSRHFKAPLKADYVILQGSLALKAACRDGRLNQDNGKPPSAHDWRGHEVPGPLTLPGLRHAKGYSVLHLADLFRDPKMRWVSELDWRKAKQWINNEWPKPVPQRLIVQETNVHELDQWFEQAKMAAPFFALDTEFIRSHSNSTNSFLTLCSLGYRGPIDGIQGIQIEWCNQPPWLRERFAQHVKALAKVKPIVLQNAIADLPLLEQWMDIKYDDYTRIEDTMLAHAVLWCELPHTLEFMASVTGQYPKLKHLSSRDPLLYNWGDTLETITAWESLQRGFSLDKESWKVYNDLQLPLIPHLLKQQKRGIRVNKERVLTAIPEYERKLKQANELAQSYAGWPINIGSDDQLKYYLFVERGLPVQYDKDTKRSTTNDDAIAVLRSVVGPPFDPDVALTYDVALARVEAGADPILEARVLYVDAQHTLDNYLYPLVKLIAHATTDTTRKAEKVKICTRLDTLQAEQLVDRIYPNIGIHSQKSGRHSTSNPPLAQLPSDLRDIICPDEGYIWIKWDWSAIEPRVLQALSGSTILLKSFIEKLDLHTWTVCTIFGYELPPNLIDPHKDKSCEAWRQKYKWQGKDDPRRVFAKAGRYEVWYGGTGSNAASAAAQYGLKPEELKKAVQLLASSDPDYYKWRQDIEQVVKRTRLIRTFMGRPRRFLSKRDNQKVPAHVIREALNHPMQGGVADIYNATVRDLGKIWPDDTLAGWLFGMHDSQFWQIKQGDLTESFYNKVKEIVQRAWTINGQLTEFPADFGLVYPPEPRAA